MNEKDAGIGKQERPARGPFAIFETKELAQPNPPGLATPEGVAAYFEHGELAAKYGEEATRARLHEMTKAIVPGTSTTVLFAQGGENGFSLVHVWFGPHFNLFRHSHPAGGDCLYYVLAGEVLLGKRRLGPGSGFFVPNGMPYKYVMGPEGAEVLEFRAGGGATDAPLMKLDEHSLDSIQRLIDAAKANRHLWTSPPKHAGETLVRARGR